MGGAKVKCCACEDKGEWKQKNTFSPSSDKTREINTRYVFNYDPFITWNNIIICNKNHEM